MLYFSARFAIPSRKLARMRGVPKNGETCTSPYGENNFCARFPNVTKGRFKNIWEHEKLISFVESFRIVSPNKGMEEEIVKYICCDHLPFKQFPIAAARTE
ncbi:hypothetical protein POVWA2_037580 [Plasmodium ovale wallikeri]|uniref:Uncharacterized protein n=1 Tax=Plasmodium ovale wallikeri TaxID=864142 RepID=A0A1A8Z4P1_PLAOA|nr:hypothetical protein POVWA1_038600 [Plasmodium ovale wallikeri]SBT39326.1 hypothetical protein POVWA2_037580 [Plasmodium ovale wallikeri]